MQAVPTAAFEAFVSEAKALLRGPPERPVDHARFEAFAREATELLLGDARGYVEWLADAITALEPALETIDVLHVARVDHDENGYTELLVWLLDPASVGVAVATAAQRAWVAHVTGVTPGVPVRPRTQVWTDDGIPDLVLAYPGRPLVVEAKTGTVEHTTPGTGLPQTIAYPPAVRRTLRLGVDAPCDVVFLTLDRSAAANVAARSVSYLETAWVLAVAVEPELVPGPLRDAWRSIIGHLARCAVPEGVDLPSLVEIVRAWRRDPAISLVPHTALITRCEDILPRSRR